MELYFCHDHFSYGKKKPEYKAKPKADIDFENELWEAANELRGAVAENQYKEFVLSLLFVKHLSERYKYRYDELTTAPNNHQSRTHVNYQQIVECPFKDMADVEELQKIKSQK